MDNKTLIKIINLGRKLAETREMKPILGKTMEMVIDLLQAEYGYLILVDENGEVDIKIGRDYDQNTLVEPEDEISRTILNEVISKNKPLILDDAASIIRSESTQKLRLRSVICTPLIAQGKTLGAIYVENRTEKGLFEKEDLDLLKYFAALAAVAIDNAMLNEFLEERIQQRTLELKESEERYRIIVEDQVEFVVRWLPDGMRTYVNESYCQYRDQTYDELVGSSYLAQLPIVEKKRIAKQIKALTPDCPTTETQYSSIRADGNERWIHWTDRGIFDKKGNLVEVQSVGRDITDAKNAKEALQESEEKLRSTFASMDDLVFVLDDKGVFLDYYQPDQTDLFYKPAEEFLGKAFQDVLPAHIVEMLEEAIETVINSGDVTHIEYPMEIAGKVRWFSAKLSVRRGDNNKFSGITIVARDISDRKWAEDEITQYARQQELLNEITQAANEKLDFQDMLQTLADRLGRLLVADCGCITLWDEERDCAIPGAAFGPMRENFSSTQSDSFALTITEKVLASSQVLIIEDITKTDLRNHCKAAKTPRYSLLALPLIAGERKLGAAIVSYRELYKFTKKEIERAEQAARQIALAIMKASLLESEREQRKLAETLQETGATLSASLDIETVLDRILELIGDIIPYDGANIVEIHDGHTHVIRDCGYECLGTRGLEIFRQREWEIDKTPSLRSIVTSKKSQFISDTPSDTTWIILEKWPFHSWVGTPVIFEEEVIAILMLDKNEAGFYKKNHAQRLAAFAGQAALAIKNAQLYQQAKETAILQERTRLARDLHDAVSQSIFSLTYFVQAARKQLEGRADLDQIKDFLTEIDDSAHRAIREMRLLLFELQPRETSRKSLVEALRFRLNAVERRAGIQTVINAKTKLSLPSELEDDLYRIAQEALNNILKHTHADTISVTLISEKDRFIMEIVDNGEGFDFEEIHDQGGMGLDNMIARTEAHNGSLEILSQPGGKTNIRVIVPLKKNDT